MQRSPRFLLSIALSTALFSACSDDPERVACEAGTFSDDGFGPCEAFSVCGAEEFEAAAPTSTSDRECAPYAVTCAEGEYEVSPRSATSDRECAALTVCEPGQVPTETLAEDGSATRDRVCCALHEGHVGVSEEAAWPDWDGVEESCVVIDGDLLIEGDAPLPPKAIGAVTGDLVMQETEFTNVDFLSELATVGGYLGVYGNEALTNLNGLSKLTTAGSIDLDWNSALQKIDGFDSLVSITDDVYVYDHAALTEVSGFPSLKSIGGDLDFDGNSALTHVSGFGALETVGDDFYFNDNQALVSLDGFAALTRVEDGFYVYRNPALKSINGFSALTHVDYVEIDDNASLESIDGFASLATIADSLSIYDNASLVSVGGFPVLASIGGDLGIWANAVLSSISGFNADLEVDGGVYIYDNDKLCQADAEAFAESFTSGFTDVHSNGADAVCPS